VGRVRNGRDPCGRPPRRHDSLTRHRPTRTRTRTRCRGIWPGEPVVLFPCARSARRSAARPAPTDFFRAPRTSVGGQPAGRGKSLSPIGFVDFRHAPWRRRHVCRSMRGRYSPTSIHFNRRARRSADERGGDGPVVAHAPARTP
jgi:hypothetical protein